MGNELERDLGLERHPLADQPVGGKKPTPPDTTVADEDWTDEDERRLARQEE